MNQPLLEPNAPYSQEAEEAVIGAVLINPDSFVNVASFLKHDDFYFLRHNYIWQAFERLNERSDIIDYLTVAEELQHMNLLDEIGGRPYLTKLVNSTPTSLYAEVYGRLVERTAIRRKLLMAADEIKKLAFDEEMSVDSVLSEAETKLFNISDSQMKREFVPMWQAISEYYDRIEHLLQNRHESLGVPSGFNDLDQLLGGFQKSDLIVFAGRPGMGKTSFMLTAAINAARVGARIAIFTMEMGVEQLIQRMIAMESGINMQKLRLANLTAMEQARFTEVVGRIANFNIFIDDTPALSPIQIRTKCHRLAHEHGLDMVMIDYMQLMNGGSGYVNNRVQEISYISRSLKELARELNVPLFSAAQLSRAVEQRQDKRPVLSDLRESGCITGDSLVYLPDEGYSVPIRDLVGKSGFRVLSLDTSTWKLSHGTVTNAFATGTKPVYKLTTALGRTIRATGNHKFLTICGWKRLDELSTAEHIALPRTIPTPTEQTMSDDELALLGHLIGDGCTLPSHTLQYTTVEPDLAETVLNLASNVFGDEVRPRIQKEKNRNWYQVFLPPTRHLTHGVRNPVGVWLENMGAFGLRSHEKFIPDCVFAQPKESIAHFLRHLWSTDGCIKMRKVSGGRLYPTIFYATSSKKLAYDVQTLLLMLDINARVKCVPQVNKGRDQYHVIVTGIPDFAKFIDVGAVGKSKQHDLELVAEHIAERTHNTNRDVIPNTIWQSYVIPAMDSIGMSTRQMQAGIETQYCGTSLYKNNVGRERALRVAEVVQSSELSALATSDVYWDRIVSIELDGEEEVFDLTVETYHNFVSCNIIVHNSIEQDSDVVMFLYRDEVYNEATEFPNQADVIVSKHRNGPTGTISLYFEKSITKFMDASVHRVDLSDFDG